MQDPLDLETNVASKSATWRSWVGAFVVTAAIVAGGVVVLGGDDGGGATPTSTDVEGTASDGDGGGFDPQGGPGGRGAVGEITAIDGTSITLDVDGVAYTVETSEETEISETVGGSTSDVAVGDTVTVIGEVVDGAVTADVITEGDGFGGRGGGPGGGFEGGAPPEGFDPGELPEGLDPPEGGSVPEGATPPQGRGFGGFTSGEVTSVVGPTFTVLTGDGEVVTVTTTDETTVTTTVDRDVDDLEVGETIQVLGETTGVTIDARTIRAGALGGLGPGGGFGGPPSGEGTEADG